jgi:spore germination protein YaaH
LLICRRLAAAALFLSFAAVGSLLPPASQAAEDEPENARRLPIERLVSEGKVNRTPYFAIIRDYADSSIPPDAWIPSELLADMKCPVHYDEGGHFTARVQNPADLLGLPELKDLLPNRGAAIDLDFAALSNDSGVYFNMTGMEKVTGITGAFVDSRRKIVPPASGDILVVGAASLMPEKARIKIPDFTRPELTPPFSLVWDHVIKYNPDLSSEEAMPTVKAISPTWFALSGDDGTVSNKAAWPYAVSAHSKGYSVWALVSNGFDKGRTSKFLSSASHQNNFIARMLAYSKLYGFDGINIDFENVDGGDASRLTAFVKKFADASRASGLLVTMDLPVPSSWGKAYERHALAEAVDYIAVMTYDEHWSSSPRAGSTASLPWTEAGVQRTLAEVPADKLLMGAPFYTREWAETKNKKGKISVKARTMSMASADLRLEEAGASMQWLGDKGQNYFQYVSDDKTYKIWVEDGRSMALRMALVKKFGLAGAAFWRKGFEKPEIWTVIGQSLGE